jgi:hypothetical protein
MTEPSERTLSDLADRAASVRGIVSATIFGVDPASHSLALAAAAGITGPPLEALAAAVRHPGHPIAMALADEAPTIDVLPTAPGGPRLRSHFPLRRDGGDGARPVGVLAVAHNASLDGDQRLELIDIAAGAASALAP